MNQSVEQKDNLSQLDSIAINEFEQNENSNLLDLDKKIIWCRVKIVKLI